MKLHEAFPSKYLTAADLDGQDLAFTIAGAKLETLGQGDDAEQKIVLALRDEAKGLVINRTNATSIAKLHGDDTDDWIGKVITIGPREVQFGKDMVWSIRVVTPPPVRRGAVRTQASVAPDVSDDYADAQAATRRPAQH